MDCGIRELGDRQTSGTVVSHEGDVLSGTGKKKIDVWFCCETVSVGE